MIDNLRYLYLRLSNCEYVLLPLGICDYLFGLDASPLLIACE